MLHAGPKVGTHPWLATAVRWARCHSHLWVGHNSIQTTLGPTSLFKIQNDELLIPELFTYMVIELIYTFDQLVANITNYDCIQCQHSYLL